MAAPEPTYEPFELEVDASGQGQRLDRWLSVVRPEYSRAALQRWIESGRVFVDGQPAEKNTKLRVRQTVRVVPARPEPLSAEPEAIALDVLFEDDQILVINKPGGLVVHPAPGHASGTLVNAVLHHAQLDADEFEGTALRPGIVHRLDKDTSGVLVVAKTPHAHAQLVTQFQAHSIEREYVAIVLGKLPARVTFDTLHGRHPTDRKRFSSRVTRGRRAVTHVEVIERLSVGAYVRCRLETGRTHQIRVHLSEHGAPIFGDPVYGHKISDPKLRALAVQFGRQALHARLLGFVHPTTGTSVNFEAPPPDDFLSLLEALRRR